MREPVEQRGCHFRVPKHARPFAEGKVGRDDDGRAFVEPADQMEQELAASLGEGQIAEFVEDDEVEAREIVSKPPLPASTCLRLQPVDEIDGRKEAAARASTDAGAGDGDRQMSFAGSRAANEYDVALLDDEAPPARSRTSASLIGVSLKAKSSTSLASGSLATVS